MSKSAEPMKLEVVDMTQEGATPCWVVKMGYPNQCFSGGQFSLTYRAHDYTEACGLAARQLRQAASKLEEMGRCQQQQTRRMAE